MALDTTAAADQAAIVTSGYLATSARDEALSQGGYASKNLAPTAVDASGTNNSTITINGAAGVEAIASKFADAIAAINDSASLNQSGQNEVVSNAIDKLASFSSGALGQVGTLSEVKQTEGISSLGRIALWGMAIIVAGLLIWKWKR